MYIDWVGFLAAIAWVVGLVSGVGTPISATVGTMIIVTYAVVQALIAALLWNNYALVIPVAVIKLAPFANAIPVLTILAVVNGYRTGWKY